MLFLVALCATAATAIGTIAIIHAIGAARCPSVLCTNFSPLIMVLVSNALLGSFMCYLLVGEMVVLKHSEGIKHTVLFQETNSLQTQKA
jgi:hypothetical protein